MADENDEIRKPVFWPGPWHFVQAVLDAPQMWGVNGVPTKIENETVIAFMLSDDALHFVNTDRAIDLGVWNSLEELNEAYAAENARQQKEQARRNAKAEKKDRAHGKERHSHQTREQGQAAQNGGRA